MKTLLFLIFASIASAQPKKIWARLTYYNPSQAGGWKVAASKSIKNKQGVGIAAHPDFKFYTRVEIPVLNGVIDKDATFWVLDRGRDVTAKKASKGKAYVFDVFVTKTGRAFKNFCKTAPEWGWVYVE